MMCLFRNGMCRFFTQVLYFNDKTFQLTQIGDIAMLVLFSQQSGDLEKTYFGVDCLHFSVHGHAAAALALWKNMV